ncbi:hypothetical protein GJ179_11485 [Salmonella enterica subsp. enterica]|nr:hypothetical protein [Salmonella enterica]EEI1253442.1 hypothetical protein [Salmonella enterica subsp. enterica]EEL2516786.1 hypothetical protein [Salmonella enterica]EEO4172584.1 hypothetical protein [Salmonella enterica subsp. enterica]EIO8741071.1 hypothetical protein [Salmonella enterica]
MSRDTIKRSSTAGIPDFVPRKSATDAANRSQVKSTHYTPDVPEQTLAPVTPCFSQTDIDEFLARKSKQFKMTERDYKELGKNTLLGIGDLITGTAATAIFGGSVIVQVITETPVKPVPTYEYGCMGWGWYDENGDFV